MFRSVISIQLSIGLDTSSNPFFGSLTPYSTYCPFHLRTDNKRQSRMSRLMYFIQLPFHFMLILPIDNSSFIHLHSASIHSVLILPIDNASFIHFHSITFRFQTPHQLRSPSAHLPHVPYSIL